MLMKKFLPLFDLLLITSAVLFINAKKFDEVQATTVIRPLTKTINSFYISNKTPLQPLNFVKLPIGSIQPEGWIKKYLELQRDGLTGHLGEISAWLEKKNNAW